VITYATERSPCKLFQRTLDTCLCYGKSLIYRVGQNLLILAFTNFKLRVYFHPEAPRQCEFNLVIGFRQASKRINTIARSIKSISLATQHFNSFYTP
jgi:hypothetical protein